MYKIVLGQSEVDWRCLDELCTKAVNYDISADQLFMHLNRCLKTFNVVVMPLIVFYSVIADTLYVELEYENTTVKIYVDRTRKTVKVEVGKAYFTE